MTTEAKMPFTRALRGSGLATRAAAVLAGSILIAVAAQVEVPMVPVPMTMQTAAVLAVGLLYGSRLGALTVLAYLAWGAVGLPVFAGGANLAGLLAKPFTIGYLVGFVLAAGLAGAVAERGAGILRSLGAVLLGTAAIYACGLAWLAAMLGGDFAKAVQTGLLPFLVGDAIKAALAVAAASAVGRLRM